MQLYVRNGAVVAWHEDAGAPDATAYGAGVAVQSYAGALADLGCVGDLPEGWPEGARDPRPYKAPAVDLRAYAAAARYARETAGITVGTAPIATDRDSQALITGMWAAAQINPDIQIAFKSGSGFVTIGAAQVAKIAAAVAAHVQACFTAEAQVVADIASGKIKAASDVDAAFSAVTA